jgi:hypothetical protein
MTKKKYLEGAVPFSHQQQAEYMSLCLERDGYGRIPKNMLMAALEYYEEYLLRTVLHGDKFLMGKLGTFTLDVAKERGEYTHYDIKKQKKVTEPPRPAYNTFKFKPTTFVKKTLKEETLGNVITKGSLLSDGEEINAERILRYSKKAGWRK